MADRKLEQIAALNEEQRRQVLDITRRVTEADGASPLSEQSILDIKYGAAGIEHLLETDAGNLVGYAHLDPASSVPTVELVGLDDESLTMLTRYSISYADHGVRIWAHGTNSPVGLLLTELGLHPERVLLQLRASLTGDWDPPAWPLGVTVRTFVIGQDETQWLRVNNAAFATHPEQSNWTLEDLERREHEKWFDPAGLFLAERDGQLVGFHWTKVHEAAPPDGQPIGEVYVVGVDPSMQGQRLGSALTAVGLIHLKNAGLPNVMLYVDEGNTQAVHVYQRLGFSLYNADTSFVS